MDEVPKVRKAVQHAATVTRVRGVEVFDGVKKSSVFEIVPPTILAVTFPRNFRAPFATWWKASVAFRQLPD